MRDVAAVHAGERGVEAELERERLRTGKHATRAQRHVHAASDELLFHDENGEAHLGYMRLWSQQTRVVPGLLREGR